jgi:hypothetical protein
MYLADMSKKSFLSISPTIEGSEEALVASLNQDGLIEMWGWVQEAQ